MTNQKTKIEIATTHYNEKRYGKPWIARVAFDGAKPIFDFISWCGEAGCTGEFEFEATVGEVFCRGQKDMRKGRANMEYMIYTGQKNDEEGIYEECGFEGCGKVAAKKQYKKYCESDNKQYKIVTVELGFEYPCVFASSSEASAKLEEIKDTNVAFPACKIVQI